MSPLLRGDDPESSEPGQAEASAPPAAGAALRRAVSDATSKIEGIIDAAERVAGEIQADAQSTAAEYLAERKREADAILSEQVELLSGLAQQLSDRSATLRRESEETVSALEDAVARLRTVATSQSATQAPAPVPIGRPQVVPEPQAPMEGGSEGTDAALLRATQLAVAGTERAEIEATLQRDFGLERPGELLDQILGSGS